MTARGLTPLPTALRGPCSALLTAVVLVAGCAADQRDPLHWPEDAQKATDADEPGREGGTSATEPGARSDGGADPGSDRVAADAALPADTTGSASPGDASAGTSADVDPLAGTGPFALDPRHFPFPQDVGNRFCARGPRDPGAVRAIYERWKGTFVTSQGAGDSALRVVRPENGGDTVSEGIGYGMLAAVYLDDQPTFAGLWSYARAHADDNGLMHWQIGGDGQVWGHGGATDADEDMAFALVMAARQWGTSSYLTDARQLVQAIWTREVDHDRGDLLRPGDLWGNEDVTFPSYFAPSYYRLFARLTGEPGWLRVIDLSYAVLAAASGPHGLVPEKATSSGTAVQGADGYGYNSCRVPWRVAVDLCLFGEERARTYLRPVASFFAGVGVDNLVDGYDTAGNPTGANHDVMAFLGPAAAGTLVDPAPSPFRDAAWARLLKLARDTPPPSFNYYQSSVGLLSLLTLTGNFIDLTQL